MFQQVIAIVKGCSYLRRDVPRQLTALDGSVAYPGIFSARGVQQIQLRTEGRENGDLGAVAPLSGVPLNLQVSEPGILIRFLRIYFPRISEVG
jgi:hypothetical protein